MLLLHLVLKVGESLLEALTLHFGRKLDPEFTLQLVDLLVCVSFEDELCLIFVRLLDFLLNSGDLGLRCERLAQSGEVLELGDRRVVLQPLFNDVEILLHGRVTGGHLDDFNVVREGRECVERLIDSLDELRGEAGFHVFKFTLELVNSGKGFIDHFDVLTGDLGALVVLGAVILHLRLQNGQVGNQIVYIVSEESCNFRQDFGLQRLSDEANRLPQLGNLLVVRQRSSDLLERLADDFLLHRAI